MAKVTWNGNNIEDQTGRIILITGATSGIGKETARVLAGKNASVILAVRNLKKVDGVVREIRSEYPGADLSVRELDLTSLRSVANLAAGMIRDFDRLDVLINNAGIMACPYGRTQDGFEIQMGTNHLGHFALTGHLMPLLKKTEGSRIVVVSSLAHRYGKIDLSDLHWEHRKYKTSRAYGDSKLANLYFTYELARRLEGEKGAPMVTAAHPGWTGTDLQRHVGFVDFLNSFFAQDVHAGALPTLRAGFDDSANQGDYYGPSRFFEMHGHPKKVKSNSRSLNPMIARELWHKSEQLTGVAYA